MFWIIICSLNDCNIMYIFHNSISIAHKKDHCMFSKFINGCTDWSQNWHTHWLDLHYAPCRKWCDHNSVTYVSMATKYAIYKAQSVFHKLKKIHKYWNEHIGQKFLPDTYDHTLMLYKIMTLKGQRSRSRQWYIGLARCCYISYSHTCTLSRINLALYIHRHLSGDPIR